MPIQGLKTQNIPAGVVGFDFRPSVGILIRDFNKMELDIRSFRVPLMRSIQQVMIPSIRKNFDVGGRPKWPKLAPYTLERREKEGARGGPLVRSGKLKKTATQINIWTVTSTFAAIKSLPENVWYGALHQMGHGAFAGSQSEKEIKAAGEGTHTPMLGVNPRSSKAFIPQRQFISMQQEDMDDIEDVFADWLDERIAGVVRRR